VKVIVSENANYSSPIVNKILKSGIYASQINYPFFLQNLKPNTTYYKHPQQTVQVLLEGEFESV